MELVLGARGEAAALGAAFLWAVSTVIFGQLGKRLAPLALNLSKGLMAVAMIAATLAVGQMSGAGLGAGAIATLLASGIIGIGIGDTAYFTALNHMGPRRVLLMETLAPPMAALLAWGLLGEALSLAAWGGIALTLLGVAWVISERVPGAAAPTVSWQGLGYGLVSAAGQAVGAVLSRAALADTPVDPLWSTLLRLAGGLAVMAVLLPLRGPVALQLRPLRSAQVVAGVAIAALLGTYLGIWLQQTSLKYAPTGIAQALTSTSPLFVLPIAAVLGERISLRAVLGVVVAIGGVWLLLGA